MGTKVWVGDPVAVAVGVAAPVRVAEGGALGVRAAVCVAGAEAEPVLALLCVGTAVAEAVPGAERVETPLGVGRGDAELEALVVLVVEPVAVAEDVREGAPWTEPVAEPVAEGVAVQVNWDMNSFAPPLVPEDVAAAHPGFPDVGAVPLTMDVT